MKKKHTIDISAMPGVPESFGRIGKLMTQGERMVLALQLMGDALMANREDLIEEIQGLREKVQQDQKSDQGVVDGLVSANKDLTKTVDELKAKVAELDQPEDFSDIIASLEEIKDSISTATTAVSGEPSEPGTPSGETDVPTEG